MQAGAEFESASSVVSQLYYYTVGQRNEEVEAKQRYDQFQVTEGIKFSKKCGDKCLTNRI